MRRVLLAGVLFAVLTAAPARASTVSFSENVKFTGAASDEGLIYVAAAGEVNALTVTQSAQDKVTFTDPGATISPGSNCAAVDAHTAVCTHAEGLDAKVSLGDGNDKLDAGSFAQAVDVDGGPGDDSLVGSPHQDTFDGGPGKDTMLGGGFPDSFRDSDADADVIDGGKGGDDVSFAGRSTPVELAEGKTAEGDELRSLETVEGTRLDDRIATGDADDMIEGGAGDDTISAGAGDDQLIGGKGDDDLDGGAGNDSFDESGRDVDTVQCGGGKDSVQYANAHEYLRNCESLSLSVGIGGLDVGLTAKRVASSVLRYRTGCGFSDSGRAFPCSNTLAIKDAKGRLLASGQSVGSSQHPAHSIDVTLTAFGARVGKAGVRATATIRLKHTTRTWSFTFRVP